MKTAIYIEDGLLQLVLTPQNDFEKNTLESFADKTMDFCIKNGSFYETRGGWMRQDPDDKSLFLIARKPDKDSL